MKGSHSPRPHPLSNSPWFVCTTKKWNNINFVTTGRLLLVTVVYIHSSSSTSSELQQRERKAPELKTEASGLVLSLVPTAPPLPESNWLFITWWIYTEPYTYKLPIRLAIPYLDSYLPRWSVRTESRGCFIITCTTSRCWGHVGSVDDNVPKNESQGGSQPS